MSITENGSVDSSDLSSGTISRGCHHIKSAISHNVEGEKEIASSAVVVDES